MLIALFFPFAAFDLSTKENELSTYLARVFLVHEFLTIEDAHFYLFIFILVHHRKNKQYCYFVDKRLPTSIFRVCYYCSYMLQGTQQNMYVSE